MPDRQRARGRPIRLAYDASPMADLHVDSTARIAWLLVSLRQHCADPSLRRRREFAEALVRVGVNADPTRVSRWESGSHHIPDRVLYGYDELLGHPPGTLASVAYHLRSAIDPHRPPGLLLIQDVPQADRELTELFARIESGGHDGTDWTRLAASLMQGTPMFLPEQMWTSISEKLLNESARSTGVAHIRRMAASGVIARHAPAQRMMIKSVGRLLHLSGPRFVIPAMMLLSTPDSDQVDDLLLQLFESSPIQIRRGAASVVTSKLVRGQLDEAARDRIVGLLGAAFSTTRGTTFPTDRVGVLATLDRTRQESVFAALPEDADRSHLEQLVGSGLSVAPATSRRLAVRIARTARSSARSNGEMPETDRMLVRLIEEALFHIHRERRHQATCLLSVSPYRTPLALALMQAADTSDPYVVARCLSVIAFLGPDESVLGQLLTWAFYHPNQHLRSRALLALVPIGHSLAPGTLDDVAGLAGSAEAREVMVTAAHLLGSIGESGTGRLAHLVDPEVVAVMEWWRVSGGLISEHLPSLV